MNSLIIAVDFDGTLVSHKYPQIGKEVNNAFKVLRKLQLQNVKLILYTMRSGPELIAAEEYCSERGVFFWASNNNPNQIEWTNSPKVFANIYIDDAALGCPLIWDKDSNRSVVNWRDVEALLIRKGILIG